jgi:predicted nucleotidyltransferase
LNLSPKLKQALDEAMRRIVEIAQPEAVILFGSYAEGRAGRDSDVDIVVVTRRKPRPDLAAELRLEMRQAGLTCPLDLLLLTRSEWEWLSDIPGHAMREAARSGVRLYEAA